MWMDSTGHRNNIMNARLTEGAIGVVNGGMYGRMWTHDFGGRTISHNLVVDSGDITFDPPLPQPGDTLDVNVTVWNMGSTDAFPVEVTVYLGDPGTGGTPIGDVQTAAPICQAGKSVTVQATLDTTGLPARSDVFAVVDPGDRFSESSESDNMASKALVLETLDPADFDLDGEIGPLDLFLFAERWSTDDLAFKLDGESPVDAGDLLFFIRSWHADSP
jgi:hypothetical protein